MRLKFPLHCQARISERSINIDHIKKAINEPDNKKEVFDHRIQVNKKVGNKIIEVVYYKDTFRDKKEEYLVITAYYL